MGEDWVGVGQSCVVVGIGVKWMRKSFFCVEEDFDVGKRKSSGRMRNFLCGASFCVKKYRKGRA